MKITLISIGLSILLFSCKKDYDCNCTYNNGTEEVNEVYNIGKVKEDEAKDLCADQVSSLFSSGASDITCTVEN